MICQLTCLYLLRQRAGVPQPVHGPRERLGHHRGNAGPQAAGPEEEDNHHVDR